MARFTRPSARALALLVPVALAAVAVPSVAMADALGGDGHVFNSCVDQTGWVYFTVMDVDPQCADVQAIIRADTSDPANASVVLSQVSWNEKGQPGPAGAVGAAGAAGAAGAKGANGVSGYTTVTKSVSLAKHKTSTLSLSCPTGKKVTGGGAQPTSDAMQLLASYPSANGAGWTARVFNDSGSAHSAKIYAICATA